MEFRRYQGITIKLAIVKTFSSESGLVSSDLALIFEEDFQRVFGAPRVRLTLSSTDYTDGFLEKHEFKSQQARSFFKSHAMF
jgi:hypothetical protein